MTYTKELVFSCINAEDAPVKKYGYFSNSLADLKFAVENERIGLRSIYASLEKVLGEDKEKRFETRYGYFSLFYPIDDYPDKERY